MVVVEEVKERMIVVVLSLRVEMLRLVSFYIARNDLCKRG